MEKNSSILVTGGTGSFGKAFIKETLSKYNPKRIVVYSRDEMKQWQMQKDYENDDRIRFFIGDVRDKDRLKLALNNIDLVVHAAATKIVPIAEYNPFECIKTNINGAMNVIEASLEKKIRKVVALSTDKACNPANLYGATKLASDKLFISGNSYAGKDSTKFSCVRYGNVMGSRGSIIPLLYSLRKKNEFPITDTNMTRFMITLKEGIELVWKAFEDMQGGEIFVMKCPSAKIIDIASAVSSDAKLNITGIRPGEKMHEQMITKEDSLYTYEYEDYYKILPSINNWGSNESFAKGGRKVSNDFEYSSDKNTDWMNVDEIQKWIETNIDLLLAQI